MREAGSARERKLAELTQLAKRQGAFATADITHHYIIGTLLGATGPIGAEGLLRQALRCCEAAFGL